MDSTMNLKSCMVTERRMQHFVKSQTLAAKQTVIFNFIPMLLCVMMDMSDMPSEISMHLNQEHGKFSSGTRTFLSLPRSFALRHWSPVLERDAPVAMMLWQVTCRFMKNSGWWFFELRLSANSPSSNWFTESWMAGMGQPVMVSLVNTSKNRYKKNAEYCTWAP